MINLYRPIVSKALSSDEFLASEKLAVLYHDLFDYPLTEEELFKWRAAEGLKYKVDDFEVHNSGEYYFREGKQGLIYQKLLRERISARKMLIAQKAARILGRISSVLFVGITGSLAMRNSAEAGDIDFMIITKSGKLWTTRFLVYLTLKLSGISVRKAGDINQKDKLCLNIWLDESDLVFKDRNLYTAHEIGQILPLVNKENIYQKFIWANRWAKKFWPNAINAIRADLNKRIVKANILEKFAYHLQYAYMKPKISRETTTTSRAIFHPQDWSKTVLGRLAATK